ncbi:hypothetical protein CY35_11G020300 [Sphagnum magellanicum]|nr:hypothetical protein CY35_11G020300 [Sphagnum magellanicum]
MRDRNSCQILQYLQKWITECRLRIADSSRQMMIFGHLVWGLIQVLRVRAPNDVICHQTMAIQEQTSWQLKKSLIAVLC